MIKDKDNDGFSLIELIIVVAIMAVLVSILAPQLIGQLSKAREGVCSTNRAQFSRLYNIYIIDSYDSNSLDGFLAYAADANLIPEEICPSNGECTFHISDNMLIVECSIHTGAPEITTISKFTTLDDAMINAQALYNGAVKYIADLVAKYPGFNGISALTVSGTSNTHVTLTAADGSQNIVYLAKDLNSFVNPDGLIFGDVKVYFVLDENNKPTTKVDYVAIKSGDLWAKYSPNAQQAGSQYANGWAPGIRP